MLLVNRGQKITPTPKFNHFLFKDDFKKFTRRLQINEVFNDTPFEDNSLNYNPSAKAVRTNNSELQHLITAVEQWNQIIKYLQTI